MRTKGLESVIKRWGRDYNHRTEMILFLWYPHCMRTPPQKNGLDLAAPILQSFYFERMWRNVCHDLLHFSVQQPQKVIPVIHKKAIKNA